MDSPRLLQDKVAAITGGLTGIGRAIALEYIRQGAFVGVNYYAGDAAALDDFVREAAEASDRQMALRTKSGLLVGKDGDMKRFITFPGDISKPETGSQFVAEVVKAFTGRLDIFVSNAGVCEFRDFLNIDHSLLMHTFGINLIGAFHAIQAAAQQMAENQSPAGGSIIGISSISALVGGGRQAHYTPTKAGLLSVLQSAAVALGPYNIRCNALLPGTIRTRLNDEDMADKEKRIGMTSRIPLGRLGSTRDLGGPAVFLACEELSGYVVSSITPGFTSFARSTN
ncbi:hypothetical protein KEM54_005699 [Ascosphaera aggregata]|nr:hypothetical protein KEM54_005699 [Ascosphaera aggregata]